MDKFHLTGQNQSRFFNFRNGHEHATHFLCNGLKLPDFKLKTRPKKLFGSLPLDITLGQFFIGGVSQ
jgi:hypothetical protein